MRKDKEIAIELRRGGKSYRQIKAELKVPLSTLSDWFKDIEWSRDIAATLARSANAQHVTRLRDLNRVRGEHLSRAYEEGRKEARTAFEDLKYNPLFIAGLMLYWGEGDRATKHLVRLTNTEPEIIKLFRLFLTHICRIPESKIRTVLLIYPDLNEEVCREYWSRTCGLPLESFKKSIVIRGREKKSRLSYGTCALVISSTYFKVKMLEWLKLLPLELMKASYYAKIGRFADMV